MMYLHGWLIMGHISELLPNGWVEQRAIWQHGCSLKIVGFVPLSGFLLQWAKLKIVEEIHVILTDFWLVE